MSKENKNKEKQRNSAGYVEPDRKVEKKKIACFVLLRAKGPPAVGGNSSWGSSSLSLSV